MWTAPVLLSYPRESSHANPLPVRLEVNARKARPLRNIVLELRGEPVYRIPSGKTTSLRLKGKISPGRHLLLALRAELPAKAAIGETYQIEINPQLGNLSLQGYNFTLRISTPARALGQILDIATGVYQDLVEMRGSEPAFVLLEAHRDLLAFRPQISGNLVNVLKYRDRLAVAALGRELGRLGVARTVSLRPSLESLLDALDTNASTHTILSAYRNFIGRLQLLVFLLFRA